MSGSIKIENNARVAQLVEHDLAKVGVAGSNPVSRSKNKPGVSAPLNDQVLFFRSARMVELVDTQDLKSCDHLVVRVQVPLRVQEKWKENESSPFLFKKDCELDSIL